jgi:homoserine acetyltransferase
LRFRADSDSVFVVILAALLFLQENFLVVWGEYDEIFNISLAYELQKHLGTQRAEMVVVKNCGHAPQIENPREYNRIILNFLQSPAEKSTKD